MTHLDDMNFHSILCKPDLKIFKSREIYKFHTSVHSDTVFQRSGIKNLGHKISKYKHIGWCIIIGSGINVMLTFHWYFLCDGVLTSDWHKLFCRNVSTYTGVYRGKKGLNICWNFIFYNKYLHINNIYVSHDNYLKLPTRQASAQTLKKCHFTCQYIGCTTWSDHQR